jgi:predicted Zn-dependent peptidase
LVPTLPLSPSLLLVLIFLGELEKSKEDPGRATRTAFAQATYPPSHPSYLFTPDEEIEAVRKLTRADLRAYHDSLIGLGSVTLVLVGDLEGPGAEKVKQSVVKYLGGWRSIKTELPTNYERGSHKSIYLSSIIIIPPLPNLFTFLQPTFPSTT